MAYVKCDSCEELRQNAPDFMVNGFTDNECENLAADKGLGGNSDNCTDVHDMDDCLVGMMDNEIDAYDNCDWKKFMHNFIPNVWATIKAIVCWLCGLDCRVKYLFNGDSFSLGEERTEGGSYVRPGDGVSFLIRSSSQQHTSDVTLRYIAGGLCSLVGSLALFKHSFTDGDGTHRTGNLAWGAGSTDPGDSGAPDLGHLPGNCGELLFEMRINTKEFPQIRNFYRGFGQETGGGTYHFEILVFNEGDTAYGYHGDDEEGWVVPENYIYVQARMTSIIYKFSYRDHEDGSGQESCYLSPYGFLGVRIRQNKIEC